MDAQSTYRHSLGRIRGGLPALAVIMLALTLSPRSGWSQDQGGAARTPSASPVPAAWKEGGLLRVCADPENLPFTDVKQEGFDNRIAELIAKELGDSLTYVWWPSRRGYIRNTLRAGSCDVVLGVPTGYDPVMSTKPYYRSTFYLVYPSSRNLRLTSLDDPALRTLRIGVHLIGEDQTHPPPVHALLARGISRNVVGFSTFYGEQHHPDEIFTALEKGDVDVAIVWGPLAGYFAKRSRVPLTLVALPDDERSGLPFAFDIGMGVRRSDKELQARLDDIVTRRQPEIERILREYNVPTVPRSPSADTGAMRNP